MKRSRRLAVSLGQIEIRSPCAVPWNDMRGDDRVRFCGSCRQNVYNIQELGRREAERLIARHEGRACVRILRRDDGTVVTADCWTRLRAAHRRGLLPFAAMLIVVFFAQLWAMRLGWRWLTDNDQSLANPLTKAPKMGDAEAARPGPVPEVGGIAPAPN